MKKLFLLSLALLALFTTSLWAADQTSTYDVSDLIAAGTITTSTINDDLDQTISNVTYDWTKGSSSNNVKISSARVQLFGDGQSLTISTSSDYRIKSIRFAVGNKSNSPTAIKESADAGTWDPAFTSSAFNPGNYTFTVTTPTAGGSYTFTIFKSGGTNQRADFDDIVVTYDAAPADHPTVVYYPNGATSGTVPVDANSPYTSGADVVVLGNTGNLANTGKEFAGWNTNADGTGVTYNAGDEISNVTTNIKLFAQWAYPATGTGTVTYTLTKGSDAVSAAVSGVTKLSSSSTAFSTSTLSIGSSNSKDGYCGQITGHAADFSASQYVALQFTVADGYTFTPSAVSMKVFANSTSNMKMKLVLTDGVTSVESEELACASSADSDIEFASGAFTGKIFKGNVDVILYQWGVTSKRTYVKSPVSITGNVSEECTPIGVAATGTATNVTYNSASLPFTMDKTTGVSSLTIEVFKYSDDSKVATYSNITPATSGSQAATGLSESTTYYYTITTVSAGGDYCEGETTAKSATFTTTAAPVAKPEITGAVNEEGWGTVAPSSIIVTSGDELSIADNVITCGGLTLTATPAEASAEYTYAFDSWSGVTNGQSVTTNLTATANFSRTPNTYNITYTAPTNGNYTIKVGEESAVNENTTADYGKTVTLAATPNSGFKLGSWSVYKTGDESTKVTVTNNQFTMPAYDVTVSATFVEATVLYDCSVMTADDKWLSFTGEEVTGNDEGTKDKTFGTAGNPQLVIKKAGWDKKDNIINSFIKLFGGKTSMSIVIPANKLATVTIKYGSYKITEKYLMVNDVAQNKPQESMVDGITAETYENYMGVVELTDQSGTLVLNSSTGNIYIAYVDVAITGTITPTALDNTEDDVKAVKVLRDGQIFIEKNGHVYNVFGACIK